MLVGNLGADPELRTGASGVSVLKMRLATTEVYFDKEGAKQERTDWHRVVVFAKRAEALSKILKRGDRVIVEGRLQTSSYEKEGQKHYSTEIIASEVLLPERRGTPSNGVPPKHAAQPAMADLPF